MTHEHWQRVKQVSSAALDQPETDRAGFVTAACGGDETFEREVRSLLAFTDRASKLFETLSFRMPDEAGPFSETIRPGVLPGTLIGRYRIVEEIGQGGMGTVFLAERADDEYRQRVAIKVMRDSRSPEFLKWFRDERQILASLEHPHIARLSDGGTTGDGLPYFVMEYVEGKPIDEYCRARQLSIQERVRLFLRICAAVDVAHRNLVVHLDLKPSNILVADGMPKLLDFGIARLVDPDRDPTTTVDETSTRPLMLTPDYASPEQIRREPVTTATDVYALGVLLYRLLTNRSPYRGPCRAPHELALAICEQVPERPSLVAAEHERPALAGDLDAVILKALQKDPALRYASVAQFGEDIERHLKRIPIHARAPTLSYRTGRFLARHRIAVATAALVVASIAGGLATTLWQARRAEIERERAQRHFDEVRQLANSLIFEVHDSIQDLPGAVRTRELLVTRAVEYYDRLAAEETGDHNLQRELAAAYDKLGNVLGRPYASNLGDSGAALASYRKALAIREALDSPLTADKPSRLDLWSSYYNVGTLVRETGDTAGALELHQKARALAEELLAAEPADNALARTVARTSTALSHTLIQAGHVERAVEVARRALALDERLFQQAPSLAVRVDLATDLGRVGIPLLKLGDASAAQPYLERRVAVAEELAASEPANIAYQRALSTAYLQRSQLLLRLGETAASRRDRERSFVIRQSLVAQDPEDRQSHIDLMVAHLEMGDLRDSLGDFADAAKDYQAAATTADELVAADSRYVFYRLTLVSALTRQASSLIKQNRQREAEPLVQRAMQLAEAAVTADPADARLRFELALAYAAMGDVSARSLEDWHQRSLDVLTELAKDGRLAGGTLNGAERDKMAEIQRKVTGSRSR